MAEQADEMSRHLMPPSSPPRPPPEAQQIFTPPRRPIQLRHEAAKAAALAELDDLPPEAFDEFGSSPAPSTSRATGSRPRTQSALPAQAQAAQAESSTQRIVQNPRIVQVEKKYPWTKEVAAKLKKVFKMPGFRPNQKEAIDETMAGKDGELEIV